MMVVRTRILFPVELQPSGHLCARAKLVSTTEKGRMISCDWCKTRFVPSKITSRFCCTDCHDRYHVDLRRKAMAAYKTQQQSLYFFRDDLNDATRNTERRRA